MVKHKEQNSDYIDLMEIFLAFWKYKITLVSLVVVGIILGLAFTYQQEPIYETKFTISLDHPSFNHSLLMSSQGLQNLLTQTELNPGKMPRIVARTNKNTGKATFQVRSHNPDVHEEMRVIFKQIIATQLQFLKDSDLLEKQIISKNIIISEFTSLIPYFAIKKISVENVLKEFKIIFGPTITVQPNPIKYGILGMFAGLLLVGCWMMLSFFYQAIQKKL